MTTAAPSSADGATPPTPDHDETMPGGNIPDYSEDLHDVAHQVALLRDVLQSEKRRIGFFFGAGCPLGIYDEANRASVKHIPDVAGLTEQIAAKLAEDGSLLGQWDSLIRMCDKSNVTVGGGIKINVEHILTEIRTICSLSGVQSVGTLDPKLLRDLDSAICKHIAGIVGKKLPHYKTSYHRFAEWLGKIDRDHPVEIFTTNYDLLLEESLELNRIPFFDGFVGSREPFFDLHAMEQDAVPSRWARLWKIHGSINWVRREDGPVFRSHLSGDAEQLLIYPSHLKYDQSRRMPYLAMMDRLRAFLRSPHPVLVICGYSFSDAHINDVIFDGLSTNRSAQVFALMYVGLRNCGESIMQARKRPNLSLLAFDGGVIGGRCGGFRAMDSVDLPAGSGYFVVNPSDPNDMRKPPRSRCNLGDFHHLSLFFETQISG